MTGSPEIAVVANAIENGAPIGVRRAGERWHSDMCYSARPPRGTMLYALEIPELHDLPLGDTEFASAAAPWDALPEPTQRHIYGRRAFPPTQVEIDAIRRFPIRSSARTPSRARVPLRQARRLHRHRGHGAGRSRGADRRARRPHCQAGVHLPPLAAARRLLLWDNCSVQHRAIQDYDLPLRRVMHRTKMGGGVPA